MNSNVQKENYAYKARNKPLYPFSRWWKTIQIRLRFHKWSQQTTPSAPTRYYRPSYVRHLQLYKLKSFLLQLYEKYSLFLLDHQRTAKQNKQQKQNPKKNQFKRHKLVKTDSGMHLGKRETPAAEVLLQTRATQIRTCFLALNYIKLSYGPLLGSNLSPNSYHNFIESPSRPRI